MKKIFTTTILIVLTSFIIKAQSIPNNGFENWTSMGSYNNPTDWTTLNDMTSSMSTFTCVKGTPGVGGSAFLKLTSKSVVGMGVMPGIAVCGMVDMVTFQPTSGFPISGRPQSLEGNWQYMASGVDMGFVAVALTKWNTLMMMRDTVAYSYQALQGMAMSWSSFTMPLNYMNGDDPDSCIIILSASQANGAVATANSYLYVDELTFTGIIAGIKENESLNKITISPNPVTNFLSVNLSGVKEKILSIDIFNVQGRLVKSVKTDLPNGSRIKIADLPSGNYVMKISTSIGSISKNFIKQ